MRSMRLSWNEIRVRAAAFAQEWEDAAYEKGETQSFYNDFFRLFGVKRRSVARYEEQVKKLDNRTGFIDLFWPGVLLVEQKSAGRSLEEAAAQAMAYFDALPEKQRPRYILLSDFQTFELRDLDERCTTAFALAQLPAHVEAFGFILGIQRRAFRDQDPANIRAAELVGQLHDALHASGHRGHALERFLVRIVFCLFADDTGLFEPRDIFLEFLETRTGEDGADLGPWLEQIFQTLNTPETERSATLDEDLARFPYVNGDLFREPLRIFSFTAAMRAQLLDVCHFDWSGISPAIFGALFQSVMDPAERRAQGAHYTTEKNILKVIEPLFLDDLKAEFRQANALQRGRRERLRAFQAQLGDLTFFDPACGCGNFLIIAYRELRQLEMEVIRALRTLEGTLGQGELDAARLSQVDVDQFYGIELGEFPARIAETALWMMDHIMNNRLGLEFGLIFARIPLERSPRIAQGDALAMDWTDVLPPQRCAFILGNPPFVGAKFQTPEQRSQVRSLARLGRSGGTLDYVAAWFIQAGAYVQANSSVRIGFVATNSLTQGEQVAQLWPILLERCRLEILFAHRTFAWGSDARGKAHVHVVIIGLGCKETYRQAKRLFAYPDINGEPEEMRYAALSPYLFDAGGLGNPDVIVKEENRPLNGWPKLITGSQPIDSGHYIFTQYEKEKFIEKEPNAQRFLRPLYGSKEFLQGNQRWILTLQDASPSEIAYMPLVRERIGLVRKFREKSKRASTRECAKTPAQFCLSVIPKSPFLVIPKISSERREYVPIGWLEPPAIPSDLLYVLSNAELSTFGFLTSAMHMAWMRMVAGRLESRYRYSIGIVYNTFPLPPRDADWASLEPLAQRILDARSAHSGVALAHLYDPDLMPPDLRRAHRALDRAVDRLYRRSGFASERERAEYLLSLYAHMTTPLDADRQGRRRSRRRAIRPQ